MIQMMLQGGVTPHDTYLLVDIKAPSWAHDELQRLSFERMSTYQIVHGDTKLVGYRMQSTSSAEAAASHIRGLEQDRMHTHAIPAEVQNDSD